MMLVPVRVAESRIHGLGLFATEFIACGTPVWRFAENFDQTFSDAELRSFPPTAQAHLRWFGWRDRTSEKWVLSGDHACFMNHSVSPNTGAGPDSSSPIVTTALRDIQPGEELTCDYHAFDSEAAAKLTP